MFKNIHFRYSPELTITMYGIATTIPHYFNRILAAKVAYFCLAAKDGAFLFNMILYFASIGLEKSESGLVCGLRLLGLLLGAPIWGLLADRGSHRLILAVLIVMATIAMSSQIPFSIIFAEEELNHCNVETNFTTNKSVIVQTKISDRHTKLFFVTLFLNILAAFFDTCILGILDSVTILQVVKTGRGDYGKVTSARYFGFIFGAFITNISIENFPASSVTCYAAIFCIYIIFMSGLLASAMCLSNGMDSNSNRGTTKKNKSKLVLKTFKENGAMLFFFFVVFIVGMEEAIYAGYTFVYLKELKASAIEMSACVAIGQFSCIVFSFASERINRFLRNPWYSFSIACITNAVIYIVTSYLHEPLYVLVLQLLRGASFGLFIPTAVMYLQKNSDGDTLASMLSIMNSIFFGMGAILAHVIGGYVYHIYGTKVLFLAASFIAALCSIVIITYTFIRSYCSVNNSTHFTESKEPMFQNVD